MPPSHGCIISRSVIGELTLVNSKGYTKSSSALGEWGGINGSCLQDSCLIRKMVINWSNWQKRVKNYS